MQQMYGLIRCAMLAIMMPVAVLADADGPDYFRVTGVAANDVLNIRLRGSASSDKIGSIPHDGDGIQNQGCTGGLSYTEWGEATDAERAASVRSRWCQISYDGIEGWVAGRFLGEGRAPVGAVGISSKPMQFVCDGLGAPLTLVSIATDPGVAFLRWQDNAVVLIAVPAASGAKYEADTIDGHYVFWSKGDEAMFTLPTQPTLNCQLEDRG